MARPDDKGEGESWRRVEEEKGRSEGEDYSCKLSSFSKEAHGNSVGGEQSVLFPNPLGSTEMEPLRRWTAGVAVQRAIPRLKTADLVPLPAPVPIEDSLMEKALLDVVSDAALRGI